MSNFATINDPRLPHRATLKVMTLEEYMYFLGYEPKGGSWNRFDPTGVALVGTDPIVAFCPDGNLPAPMGAEVMEPMNELATLPFWAVKALLRDYHPDGPDKTHISFSTAWRQFANINAMHFLTVDEFDQMGDDRDTFSDVALQMGFTRSIVREGITAPEAPGGLPIWVREHAGQKSRDSHFHLLLNVSLWDFAHPKGWRYPYWEEFGGFGPVVGVARASNGFHEAIQSEAQRKYSRGRLPSEKVSKMVNTALVSRFCVWNTSRQGRQLRYRVVNAIDAIRPFDPAEEESTFADMVADGQEFVTNEVAVEAGNIIASLNR